MIVRERQVQLSVLGKGGVVRQVLLPKTMSRQVLELRGDAGASHPVFAARHGCPLTERAVGGMLKRTARAAGVNEAVSPHWLRHAHGSHAIDRGAPLPEVQATLGNANVATTSGYLHARPDMADTAGRDVQPSGSAFPVLGSLRGAGATSISPLDGRTFIPGHAAPCFRNHHKAEWLQAERWHMLSAWQSRGKIGLGKDREYCHAHSQTTTTVGGLPLVGASLPKTTIIQEV